MALMTCAPGAATRLTAFRLKSGMMARDNLTGFVLAGGKSTRMGRDKAVITLHGRTLLETSLATLRGVAPEVFILGAPHIYSAYGAAIPDIFPGCGPLGGIHAALSRTATRHNLILAVDTPFVSREFLAYLADRAIDSSATVTIPEVAGYLEPACTVYTRDFLAIAQAALQRGDHKITPLLPKDRTLVIREAELTRFAFNAEMFENLNTPEDLERARRSAPEKPHEQPDPTT
jgi:molybdopterin-guanine dinucleotide biosynthesis protein A